MKTKQFALLSLCVSAVLAVSGCANVETRTEGFNLAKIDNVVTPNRTTVAEIRSIFGTPTASATDGDGGEILSYALVGHDALVNFSKNLAKDMITGGVMSHANEYTTKVAVFKFGKNGKLSQLSKDGWSFVERSRLTSWNECEFRLTPTEINTDTHYEGDEICKAYVKRVSAQEKIPASKVDTDKEFDHCNLECMAQRAIRLKYPKAGNVTSKVPALKTDGNKKDLLQW